MKIQFDTWEEYESMRLAVHDGILYWKKVRQMCQGKINMNADGGPTHHEEQYAVDMMIAHAKMLDTIEKSPHPEWNEETKEYELTTQDYESNIVAKVMKLMLIIPKNVKMEMLLPA